MPNGGNFRVKAFRDVNGNNQADAAEAQGNHAPDPITANEDLHGINVHLDLPNSPPTDVHLSHVSVPENQAPGTFVGEFNATDANEEDVHTFALIEGNGSTHNHLFAIVDGPGSASQDMSIDFSLPHDVQGPPKQWFKDLEIGEIGGTLILDLNTGLAGDRVILKLGSATIFDTGVWKTSGNSQNGDPDRFFVHFSPGSPTTFDFVEGATNSALGAAQLGQVIVNSAPLGEHTLRMIGETTLTFFVRSGNLYARRPQ